MREILFRGKQINTENQLWKYGDLLHDGYDYEYAIRDKKDIGVYAVVPVTVGQYTGLTDKNGTKIFEGDIVKARFKPLNGGHKKCYAVGEVVFENGTFKICVYISSNTAEYKEFTDKNAKEYPIEHNFIDRGYKLEVLGNIHDNPELLKEGETK